VAQSGKLAQAGSLLEQTAYDDLALQFADGPRSWPSSCPAQDGRRILVKCMDWNGEGGAGLRHRQNLAPRPRGHISRPHHQRHLLTFAVADSLRNARNNR
jgi:hypothetical protein